MRKVPGGISPVIAIDRSAPKPLHRQIYGAYKNAILRGEISAGQQIPSSRSLAAELAISRIPILNAYAQLLAEGYFETRVGSGTFVSTSLKSERMNGDGLRSAGDSRNGSQLRAVSQQAKLIPNREGVPWVMGAGSFSVGQLAFDEFPMRVWSNLVARHARATRASSLNYGDPMGTTDFRETIAHYLRTARAVHCEARQILIVSGSQQALDLSARVLFDPGSWVWVEEPSYTLMRHALILAGCRLVPVPVDGDGLDVAEGISKCRQARAAYVTPSHQFPLGMAMSASRRLQLLDWAKRVGAWIVEDDYDSEYRYESMPIASLQGLDHDARVIYIGTFSKTMFPALRIGYVVVPPDLVDRFAAVRRTVDIFPPYLYQEVLSDFIQQGHFARHIRRTRQLYAERRTALIDAIRAEFGKELEIAGGEAGMHLVVMLPKGIPDQEVSAIAAQRKLWLWPLSSTYMGKAARQGFILGFAGVNTAQISMGVRKLKSVLTSDGRWL